MATDKPSTLVTGFHNRRRIPRTPTLNTDFMFGLKLEWRTAEIDLCLSLWFADEILPTKLCCISSTLPTRAVQSPSGTSLADNVQIMGFEHFSNFFRRSIFPKLHVVCSDPHMERLVGIEPTQTDSQSSIRETTRKMRTQSSFCFLLEA